MKNLMLFLVFAIPSSLIAQAPQANALVQLLSVTTSERNSLVDVAEGSLIYDTDEQALYTYTTSNGWTRMQNEANTYVGSFIISARSGLVNITDVPFKPSKVSFVAHANIENYTIDADNGVADNTYGIQNSFGTCNGIARDNRGTILQQMINVGGHGNSINDISRFSSDQYCIGMRFGSQNGNDLGKIIAQLQSFDITGFTLRVGSSLGTLSSLTGNARTEIDPNDITSESLVVLYTAYR